MRISKIRIIKQSYIDNFLTDKNAKISGINIEDYYGSYDNYITLMISDIYSGTTGDISWQTIDGVKFYYNSGNQVKIWRKCIITPQTELLLLTLKTISSYFSPFFHITI